MREEWRDIKGYAGEYQVSSLGRVKSFKHCKSGRIRKQNINKYGYLETSLFNKKKSKTKRIHQLVAQAFLDHEPCGMSRVVDHINNDPLDNRLENLQIITARENTSKDRSGGSSKYLGVCFHKRDRKYKANITIKGKQTHLGTFSCDLAAAVAYNLKLKEINGLTTC